MKTRISVQERLKDLRVEKGLKLEELAEQVGLSKSALGSYENDEDKEINHGSLLKLADFYQVTVDYLLGLSDNRAHENTPLAELHLTDEAVAILKAGGSTTGCCVRSSPMTNLRSCWQTRKFMWMGWRPCAFTI